MYLGRRRGRQGSANTAVLITSEGPAAGGFADTRDARAQGLRGPSGIKAGKKREAVARGVEVCQ